MSLRHAVYTAVDMFRHREDYDLPLAHPLPKLYHEKREDGDKARFAVRTPQKKGDDAVPEEMEG
jgi:4-hydroxythreonine-4-phosphate dehydrogenase